MTPLFLFHTPASADRFGLVSEDHFLVAECVLARTGALKFNMAHDVLGLSMDETLLSKGIINQTDLLDPNFKLDKVYYLDKYSGQTVVAEMGDYPRSQFTPNVAGQFRMIQLADTMLRIFDVDGKLRTSVMLKGFLNMETGRLEVLSEFTSNEYITLLGYTVKGYRRGINYRPETDDQQDSNHA